MELQNTITTTEGNQIRLARIYIQETYLGLMSGSLEQSTQFMLEDAKSCFVPEKWQRYDFSILDVSKERRVLPPVVVVALLVKANDDGTDATQVVAWFQNTFFEPPRDKIGKLISALSWTTKEGGITSFFS